MKNRARQLCILTAIVIAILMTVNTAKNGPDFHVYWNSVRLMLQGDPLYSPARDGVMVFKYPPWIAPAFIPFALMPEAVAKALWGLVQAWSLLYVVKWLLVTVRARAEVIATALVCFIGIFQVHAFNGQVSLPILALAIYMFERHNRFSMRLKMFWVLSTKVVSLFPLFGLAREFLQWRMVLAVVALLVGLSLPPLLLSRAPASEVLSDWIQSMGPGIDPATGQALITVKGREAQGLASAVFRVFDLPYDSSGLLIAVTGALVFALAIGWHYFSRRLSSEKKWAGWLALSVLVQPLAGFHAFALAFPLAVLALDSTWFALPAVLAVSAMTSKTLGDFGAALEFVSIKSIGVLLLAGALILTNRKKSKR